MIETKKLIIRKFKISDATQMYENWAQDEEVTKYLTWDPHSSIEDTKEFVKANLDNNTILAIYHKGNSEVIGSISYTFKNANYTTCEVGYCLSKKYHGLGLAHEALINLMNYIFNKLNVKRIAAIHMVENTASENLMKSCGMIFYGQEERPFKKFGCSLVNKYEITSERFKAVWLRELIKDRFNIRLNFCDFSDILYEISRNGLRYEIMTLFDYKKLQEKLSDNILFQIYDNHGTYDAIFIYESVNYSEVTDYIEKFKTLNRRNLICINELSLEKHLVSLLKKLHLKISFAESCTGGKLVDTIISVPGASEVIEESFVTYSNNAKIKYLGVSEETLDKYTVYSKEVAEEMATGLYEITESNVCISVTGLSGSNILNINDGLFDSCIFINIGKHHTKHFIHKKVIGNREETRIYQTRLILAKTIQILKDI